MGQERGSLACGSREPARGRSPPPSHQDMPCTPWHTCGHSEEMHEKLRVGTYTSRKTSACTMGPWSQYPLSGCITKATTPPECLLPYGRGADEAMAGRKAFFRRRRVLCGMAVVRIIYYTRARTALAPRSLWPLVVRPDHGSPCCPEQRDTFTRCLSMA